MIEFVVHLNILRDVPPLRPGQKTLYLLNDGRCCFRSRDGSLTEGNEDTRDLRGEILEALGQPWNGFFQVGSVQLHYLGTRFLSPLTTNPLLPTEGIPRNIGKEDRNVTMTQWFKYLLPALQERRDIWPSITVPVFFFTIAEQPASQVEVPSEEESITMPAPSASTKDSP